MIANQKVNELGFLPKCHLCDEVITPLNNSEAHIIPNALGGRLKPKNIICRDCNTMLDSLADNALVKAFGDWPTVLDIPRDRGKNPPRTIKTRKGSEVRIEPNGNLTRVDVLYNVETTEDGHRIELAAGEMKTMRQLLKGVSKSFPHFDPSAAEKAARVVTTKLDDELKMGVDFSAKSVFGGIITAIWLFFIQKTGHSLMDRARLTEVIMKMQSKGGTFRYLVDGLPGLKGPSTPIGHKIVVRSVPGTGKLIAYVEILGVLKIGGVLAEMEPPSPRVEHIYAYDVFGRQENSDSYSIDATTFDQQDWSTVGHGLSEVAALQEHFQDVLTQVFVKHYYDRFNGEVGN